MASVSILVTAYNCEKWIEAALDSALHQGLDDFELIVVNDGSTDGTPSILSRYANESHVTIIHQDNEGAASARNVGIGRATGDYVQFLDGDDVLGPGKIVSQLSALEDSSEATIASCSWARFSEDAADANFVDEATANSMPTVDWLICSLSGGGMMPIHAWLTPLSLIQAAGPWKAGLTLHDDGEFFARVLLQAEMIQFCPDAKVYYRSHDSGISRKRSREAAESALEVCHSQREHLLDRCDTKTSRRALATSYATVGYQFSPLFPDIGETTLSSIESLGCSTLPLIGGRGFRFLCRTIGFKAALRFRTKFQSFLQQIKELT